MYLLDWICLYLKLIFFDVKLINFFNFKLFVLDLLKTINRMEFITPQIAIGLLLISIGLVSKFDIKFEIFKEKE